MLRLLVVLAVLGLAYWYFAGGADKNGEPVRPEVQMQQQQERVQGMEQQLQQQAADQLKTIDANTTPEPIEE